MITTRTSLKQETAVTCACGNCGDVEKNALNGAILNHGRCGVNFEKKSHKVSFEFIIAFLLFNH